MVVRAVPWNKVSQAVPWNKVSQKWIGVPYVHTHFSYHINHWTVSYLTQHNIRFSFDLLSWWVHIYYSVAVLSSNNVYCIINSVWRQYKWQMKVAFGHITCYFGVCVCVITLYRFIHYFCLTHKNPMGWLHK
jgi:hypothetical protein